MSMIKVGIVEDHVLFREGIVSIINSWEGLEVVFQSGDGFTVIDRLNTEERPHVMLVDLSLPSDREVEYNGLDLILDMKREFPQVKLLVLSVNDSEYFIAKLIENGAHGYLTKDCEPDEIQEAITTVYHKGTYINERTLQVIQSKLSGRIPEPKKDKEELTRREKEVLRLVCQQMTADEIGKQLFISTKTVNGHKNNLMQKTNSRNVTGLVMYAIKNGLVELI